MQDHPKPSASESVPLTETSPESPQVAGYDDLPKIAEMFALAFRDDPTWGPVLAPMDDGREVANEFWSFFISSAPRFPYTFTTSDAASVWYPPDSEEFTPEQQEQFKPFLNTLLGAERAAALLDTSERFDAARPTEPHYFLSMLATHPNARGRGLGMALLNDNLAIFDALGVPTYLESSNPANDARYTRQGYRPHGTIDLPKGLTITTFWRDPADL